MTIRIYYKEQCLFDIDYYATQADMPEEKDWDYKDRTWHLELHVYTNPKGIVEYTLDHADNATLIKDFAQDAHAVSELRGWLWEQHRREEFYAPFKDIAKVKYGPIYDELKMHIEAVCKVYGLTHMED